MLHFAAAYADPELAFLAVAVLWERFHAACGGHAGHPHLFIDEARTLLSPFLGMLGMHALKQEVDLWLWRSQEPGAAAVESLQDHAFEALAATLAPHFAAAALQRRHAGVAECCDPIRARARALPWQPLLDVTILVASLEECYRALAPLHSLFQPIDGSFADSLHHAHIDGTARPAHLRHGGACRAAAAR